VSAAHGEAATGSSNCSHDTNTDPTTASLPPSFLHRDQGLPTPHRRLQSVTLSDTSLSWCSLSLPTPDSSRRRRSSATSSIASEPQTSPAAGSDRSISPLQSESDVLPREPSYRVVHCTEPGCGRMYSCVGNLNRHRKGEHGIDLPPRGKAQATKYVALLPLGLRTCTLPSKRCT